MLRLALALLLPLWCGVALALVRSGGRRTAWLVTLGVALVLAAWAGSRVGTGNPVSRTARWDPWLAFVMAATLLALPGLAATWGVAVALSHGRPAPLAVGAGVLAGLAALPVALALAVLVEVLWPH